MTVQAERRTRRKPRLKWFIVGPLVCVVSLPILLYICAIMLAREWLPFEIMEELVIACVFLSAALGGICACKSREGRVMQTGFGAGAIFAALLVIITLVVPGEGAFTASCLKHIIAALTGGAFGGALSIKRGKRPSSRRRRK